MKYGDKYEFYEAIQARGEKSPLDDLPILTYDENIYHSDFSLLGSERHNNMSVGRIPITRITTYAKQEGILDIEMFKRIMVRLDLIYVKLNQNEQEKRTKAKAKKSAKKPPRKR